MSILQAIFVITMVQLIGFVILDKYKLGKWKMLIFLLVIVLYVFVLPNYYISKVLVENGVQCGLPSIAITLGFWIFGCGTAIIFSLLYRLIKWLWRKYRTK